MYRTVQPDQEIWGRSSFPSLTPSPTQPHHVRADICSTYLCFHHVHKSFTSYRTRCPPHNLLVPFLNWTVPLQLINHSSGHCPCNSTKQCRRKLKALNANSIKLPKTFFFNLNLAIVNLFNQVEFSTTMEGQEGWSWWRILQF